MGVSWGRVLVLMPTEGYAVVDLETTGLHPGYEHRIVEIGVVQLDESGEVLDEWSTLLNPDRDLGAQHIHGICAADVLRAPRFSDVAAHVAQIIQGRVLVAVSGNGPFAGQLLRLSWRRPFGGRGARGSAGCAGGSGITACLHPTHGSAAPVAKPVSDHGCLADPHSSTFPRGRTLW
jgi:hypothetical protein